jgi:hypothetical protein
MSSKARRMAGSQSFTVVTSTGGSKTATFTNPFPAGIYTIESISGDSDLEIYLGSADGLNVGYITGGAKAITASAPFKYVTTANANSSDAIVFSLYTPSANATTIATKTDAYWAPPTITAVSPSSLFNIDSTTTITGTNFATDAAVQFRKSDDATLVSAKQIVVGSSTSIIATRPDSFSPTDSPYDVIVTNATTGLSASSLNAITAGSAPVWSTSATLPAFQKTVAYSQAVVATDADTSPTVTYSQVSATLPTGITFNTSTATFSGTPSANGGSYNAVIRATDLGGNYADRTFTLAQDKPDAPGIGVATATGQTTATIAFTAPTYTGTSTITTYTATSSPSGGTGTLSQAGSGTITVTGLTLNTLYTFTVTATNSSGTSVASSASSSITTAGDSFTIHYLVIAGGGGSGSYTGSGGGGGGAGGYRTNTGYSVLAGTSYSVEVGVGGTTSGSAPTNGGNSIFDTITSTGGGAGGAYSGGYVNGAAGGSGGGAYGNAGMAGGAASPAGQGNPGGNITGNIWEGAGGGGGAGTAGAGGVAGSTSPQSTSGAGGNGLSSSITGTSVTRAGGGGGASVYGSDANGGTGGGGNGGSGTSGAINTGSGGGGGGGNGGSGIVILKYPDTKTITIGSGLIASTAGPSGGYKVTSITGGSGSVNW